MTDVIQIAKSDPAVNTGPLSIRPKQLKEMQKLDVLAMPMVSHQNKRGPSQITVPEGQGNKLFPIPYENQRPAQEPGFVGTSHLTLNKTPVHRLGTARG